MIGFRHTVKNGDIEDGLVAVRIRAAALFVTTVFAIRLARSA